MGEKTRVQKDRAGRMERKGQYRKAIREYERLLKRHPGDARTLHRMGELCAREGETGRALELYVQAARAYLKEGFFDRAVPVYKQAIALDAGRVEAHLGLVEAYHKRKLEHEALGHLAKAAALFEQKNDTVSVLKLLRRGVELSPGDVDNRMRLAKLYSRTGRDDEAREQYLQAALALKRAGQEAEFVSVAMQLLHSGEMDFSLRHQLADSLARRQEWDRALELLDDLVEQRSGDLEALGLLARVHLAMGRRDQAAGILRRAEEACLEQGYEERAQQMRARLDELAEQDALDAAGTPQEPGADETDGKDAEPPLRPAAITEPVDFLGGKDGAGDTTEPTGPPAAASRQAPRAAGRMEYVDVSQDEPVLLPPDEFEEITDERVTGRSARPAAGGGRQEQKTKLVDIEEIMAAVGRKQGGGFRDTAVTELTDALRESLREADFFIGQGLFDEAAGVLAEAATGHPGHPEIGDRLEEIQRLRGIAVAEATEIDSY